MEASNYLKNWTWENIQQREGKELNHIEKVDWLREGIKELSNKVLELEGGKLSKSNIWTDYIHELKMLSYKCLCEARFWLGFELERIKNNN